jgi:hypothetical protein
MMPTTFYVYKIIVELLCYPLGAVHDAVPPSDIQTDPGAPGQLAERLSYAFVTAGEASSVADQMTPRRSLVL